MKPKNFPGRKQRRQLRANMKVWEMLGIPITWEMRTQAYGPYTTDIRNRVGAKNRDEHGHVLRHPGLKVIDEILRYPVHCTGSAVHDDILDTYKYAAAWIKSIGMYRQASPHTTTFWKDSNVTP